MFLALSFALASGDPANTPASQLTLLEPNWGSVELLRQQPGSSPTTSAERLSEPTRAVGLTLPLGRTPMTSGEARLHLELAYRAVVREAPEPKTLSLLLAQWALETGRGQFMWGFNFGGIKATSGGGWFVTTESVGGLPQRAYQRFRTYRSALEGAKHYIQTLALDFPKAFAALQSGCAEQFVHALSAERYFTGNTALYCKAIASLAEEYERRWAVEAIASSDPA